MGTARLMGTAIAADLVATATGEHEPLLAVENLTTSFRSGSRYVDAVRGVSFSIRAGETLVLLGESGSGKSVTARSILHLYGRGVRHSGSVRLNGTELLSMDERAVNRLRGAQVGLVSQDPSGALDPVRRVGSQIREVLRTHQPDLKRGAAWQRAVDLLTLVGLPDPGRAMSSYPHELSGGMLQRVVIAMAVACDPDLLIADEPTTALDVTVQAQILDLISELKERLGMATLLVTHDVGVARQMADRVAVMYAGRIVEAGPGTDVLDRPAHPYTAALLSALPARGAARGSLRPIPGRPPLADQITPGCPFAPRCAQASPACVAEEPAPVEVAVGHSSACIESQPAGSHA
jgi:oligopeptide/dipeptide ABC transporter ATP-binding protein